jgi:hypothetical protein
MGVNRNGSWRRACLQSVLIILLGLLALVEGLNAVEQDPKPTAETWESEQSSGNESSDFLNRRLPEWLEIGLSVRFRGEGRKAYQLLNEDTYLLSRLRFQAGIRPASWLEFFVQGQDSRVAGLDVDISRLTDRFDFRQAHVYLGTNRMGLRAGRVEMAYGDERLIGASNWSNTSRSFDAVRFELVAAGGRTDIFASSVVQIDPVHFNERKRGEALYGIYSAFDTFPRIGDLDAYFLAKMVDYAEDDSGVIGELRVYTSGFRMAPKWDRDIGKLEVSLEAAKQWGRKVEKDLSSWAGYGIVEFTPRDWPLRPRFSAEYSYASGDSGRDDGKVETFDQLYPTNHSKYGIVDMVGWRNIKDLRFGVDVEPLPRLEIAFDYHSFWLASRHDHLYDSGGCIVVRAPEGGAEDGHVGREVDITGRFALTKRLSLGAGFGYLFPGPFLEAVTTVGPSFAYAFVQFEL